MESELTIASVESERAILGSILLNNDCWYSSEILSVDCFSLDSHRQIYAAMAEMFDDGLPVDLVTLSEKLLSSGSLANVGGSLYLASLTDGVPSRPNVNHYAKTVRTKRQLRQMIACLTNAVNRAQSGGFSVTEVANYVQDEIYGIQSATDSSEALPFEKVMVETIGELARLRKHEDRLVGLSTGLETLDRSTTGIRPSELWTIGAYPGRGKTALGMQMAIASGRTSIPTLFFSLEMTAVQLGTRSISAFTRIPSGSMRDPKYLNATEWQTVQDCAAEMAKYPIYVDDASTVTTKDLAARLRLYVRKYGVKLIILDYVQLIEGPEREDRIRVGKAANILRKAAKDHNIAVVCISQLSRPKGGDMNEPPNMNQLRESGEIEAHSHVILLLHTPEDKMGNPTGEDAILIKKQRNGPKGPIPVWLDGKTNTFRPREVNE